REFAQRYHPQPVPGIRDMLRRLHEAGHAMGLVTANIAANVEPSLHEVMPFFDRRCLFYMDRYHPPRSKSWCLAEGANILGAPSGRCVFVGDQPADADAARAAGWGFLGVAYGWGQLESNPGWQVVEAPADIADAVFAA
ncbi:MAG: HAD family hydrolase, partial [Caldimonas sp.]